MAIINKFKVFFFILIMVLNSLLINATFSFNSYVNNEETSIDLTYGESKSIPINVVSNNDWCDITCELRIDKAFFYNFNTLNYGESKPTTYTVNSPIKGKEGDSKTISFEIVCNQVDSLTCGFIEGTPKNTLLTVTYHLTQAQREARDYVNLNLPLLTTALTSADTNIKKIEDKLSQLSANVKVSSIRTDINTIRSDYSSYKSNANNIKSLFENLDYIPARNSFSSSLTSNVNSLTSQASSLEQQLDDTIRRHNEIANKIRSLEELNNNIKNKLRVLNEDNKITSEIEDITSRFNIGNFDSYDSLESEVNSLESEGKNVEKELANKIESLKKEVALIFSSESDRLCKKENICSDLERADTIEVACSGLKELSTKVISENVKREKDFDNLKNKVKNFNEEVKNLDNKFKEINIKLKDKSLDIKNCNSLIDETNDKTKNNEISSLNNLKGSCLGIEKMLESENVKSKGFFGKIFSFFSRIFGVKSDQIKEIKILNEPIEPLSISISDDANEFITSKCKFDLKKIREEYKVSSVQVTEREVQGESIGEAKERDEQCCAFGGCTSCCKGDSCRTNPKLYPIVFVHGHAPFAWNSLDYSINSLSDFQQRLEDSSSYIMADILLPTSKINSVKGGDWGKLNKPVSIRISYYWGVYDDTGKTIGKEEGKPIDVYSQRLSDIIDKLLHHTEKDKVIIIAHSMGGLVSRNYIKNGGANKVYKLITIGTPNHGIYGWLIGGLCGATHGALPECQDMQSDSVFMKRLNSGDETAGVNTLSIIANCAVNEDGEAHDEVVRVSSAKINGAKNVILDLPCVGSSSPIDGNLHQGLTRNDKVYQEAIKFLNG